MLGGSNATSGTVDLLAAAPSVSQLTFDADHTMTITSTSFGGGQLALDNGSYPIAVTVSSSGNLIDGKVSVILNSNASITTAASSDSLTIAGNIGNGAAAHGIVKNGLGTLILSGDDTYTGGTSVDAGTLILAAGGALPAGASLTVGAGGAVLFDPTAAATAMPASPDLALAGAGTLHLRPAGRRRHHPARIHVAKAARVKPCTFRRFATYPLK